VVDDRIFGLAVVIRIDNVEMLKFFHDSKLILDGFKLKCFRATPTFVLGVKLHSLVLGNDFTGVDIVSLLVPASIDFGAGATSQQDVFDVVPSIYNSGCACPLVRAHVLLFGDLKEGHQNECVKKYITTESNSIKELNTVSKLEGSHLLNIQMHSSVGHTTGFPNSISIHRFSRMIYRYPISNIPEYSR
jgi:hypothetical protein